MKSQTSQGQQSIKSTQPAAATSTGKKLVTESGNFLISFLNFFFFMTPEGTYLPWKLTIAHGALPNSYEWRRLHKECNLPVIALTTAELIAAQAIYEALKLDRYYGLTPLQKSLAIVHRRLYLRKQAEEKTLPATKQVIREKFVPVKASKSTQIPAQESTPKRAKFIVHKKAPASTKIFKPKEIAARETRKPATRHHTRVIDITSFNRELGVDPSIPVEVRRAGENLVVHGKFACTNTLNQAPGFSALYNLQFAEKN